MLRLPDSRILLACTAAVALAGCNLIFGIQDGTLGDGTGGGGAGASVTTSTSGGGQNVGGAGPGGASGQGGDGGGSPLCIGVTCDDSKPCTDDTCVAGECEHPFSTVYTPCVEATVPGECSDIGTCIPDECVPSLLVTGARIGQFCGVFVAPGVTGTGTRGSPTGDLGGALSAVANGQNVYVCGGGSFTGNFSMKAGTRIFGGLSCDWTSAPANLPGLRGSTVGQPTLLVQNGSGTAVIEQLNVVGASAATGAGASSVALQVDQATVTIRNCIIESGLGGEGQPGATSVSNPAPGGPGGNGLVQVCGSTADTKGQFGTSPCGNQGGFGGDGGVIGSAPFTGFAGQPGQGPSGGAGGSGETSTAACTDGQPGSAGATGAVGSGGSGDGSLSGGFQPASPPGPGAQGANGNGGGGGGGDGGFGLICTTTPATGRAGGGGGGGGAGCRGDGGGGGRGGGASFAIVALGASITIENSMLRASAAGQGGAGVQGEPGSAGGAGGSGASGSQGCSGGAGGAGGRGGPGGGGVGGPAALVARTPGGSVTFVGTNALELPIQALGGAGAVTGTLTGGTGAAGTTCDELVYGGTPFATCIDH